MLKVKTFLTTEPTIERNYHVFSTLDPVDGFVTIQGKTNARIESITLSLKGNNIPKISTVYSFVHFSNRSRGR